MTPLTVGSLFSGIGGLDLGLERAGRRTSRLRRGGVLDRWLSWLVYRWKLR